MKTVKCSVAQALVRFLNQVYIQVDDQESKYVTGFATIFGHGNVLGLGEALTNEKHDFKLIQGKNEQGMCHLVLGYSKQNNRTKIIACSASVGPGSANMLTAAATATANNLPLLLLCGDVFASRKPDPVLQQIEQNYNLNISTNDAFKAVTKYWDKINRPEQLINSLIWAIEVLVNPQTTGAVMISLPQDVQAEIYDFPEWFFQKRVYKIKRPCCDQQDLITATQLLSKAKYPLIIVGGGARYSQATKAIESFCNNYYIPFANTQAGFSTVPSSNEFNLGGIGVTGNLQANLYAQKADVIIGIGTKYSDFTTGSKSLFNSDVKFININIKPYDALKMLGLDLIGDAKTVLNAWNKHLKKVKQPSFELSVKPLLQEFKTAWNQELTRIKNISTCNDDLAIEVKDDNKQALKLFAKAVKQKYKNQKVSIFHQAKTILLINEILKDQVIVGAAGSLPGDLQRLWKTDRIDSYNLEYGYSCMGHEIQAAIGASLALNYQPVYAFCGDGSFMMLHSELHTALIEQIPVVVLLFDNSGFGCINNLQLGFANPSFETQFQLRKKPKSNVCDQFYITDFTKIAQGYGLEAELATSEEHLIALLKKSKTTTKPMLIEIKVYPKTMTHGYEANWQVGVVTKSNNSKTATVAKKSQQHFIKKQFN